MRIIITHANIELHRLRLSTSNELIVRGAPPHGISLTLEPPRSPRKS